ncbi:ammonium transporter [Atractiella rhizophila]|nr:ammonium transporter [Atractiella rhizophila]
MVNVTFSPERNVIGEDGTLYNNGDIAWILSSAALVMIMTPGVGFLYSGLLRRKNALSMLYLSLAVYAVITFQWFFWGYSLTFSATGGDFIGNLDNFGLKGILDEPSAGSDKLPGLTFVIYQSMFAAITPAIAVAGMAERGRIGPCLVFCFAWATIVYDPIACWTWAANGWGFKLGSLDFAGGGPVHMSSGTAALAYSLWLGKRRGYGTDRLAYKPHSVSHVILGTTFLWFGWFGFNGGSALGSNVRATQAFIVTNISAAAAGLTWCFLDYRLEKKWSAVGLCSGILAGLVGITPAAGFVGSPAALAIGVITAFFCNFGTKLKYLLRIDDAIDGFALHGIGGFVGSICTGLFADARVVTFDGTVIDGGWINHHWVQLGYQLATSVAIISYTFVVTSILLIAMDKIPGFSLRVSEEAEIVGVDEDQLGEWGYDYAETTRDIDGHIETESRDLKKSSDSGSAFEEKQAAGHPRDPHNFPQHDAHVHPHPHPKEEDSV